MTYYVVNKKEATMGKTFIQWTDHTWNPWLGCRRVSAGYYFCYTHRMMHKQNPSTVRRNAVGQFSKTYGIDGNQLIFTFSTSDFFIEEADVWRPDARDIIRNTPQHTYRILTKRVGRIKHCLPPDWGLEGYPNVILGTSIEDQNVINRMVILSKFKTPESRFRLFISAEPLIGPIDFIANQNLEAAFKLIDRVIVGGESGDAPIGTLGFIYYYRPTQNIWFDQIIAQCSQYQIPLFGKQLGNHEAVKLGLRDKKGGDINEWPTKYQIRQWPRYFS